MIKSGAPSTDCFHNFVNLIMVVFRVLVRILILYVNLPIYPAVKFDVVTDKVFTKFLCFFSERFRMESCSYEITDIIENDYKNSQYIPFGLII